MINAYNSPTLFDTAVRYLAGLVIGLTTAMFISYFTFGMNVATQSDIRTVREDMKLLAVKIDKQNEEMQKRVDLIQDNRILIKENTATLSGAIRNTENDIDRMQKDIDFLKRREMVKP